jgi:hypothetical protein
MLMKPEALRRVLSDARSGKVVFVSHCMLNQNVRYQGGATRPGAVQAVVGVGGSPSCGVRTTLDLKGVLDTIAACDPTRLNTDDFNRRVIVAHARPGQGMFIAALRRQLRRRRIDVPFDETTSSPKSLTDDQTCGGNQQ